MADTIQRANEPWTRRVNGSYGKGNRLTFSEAIGVSGGTQTTNIDASLNGHFFGKFMNVATHMGGTGGAQLLANNYPIATCAVWTTMGPAEKPHAEDYLLVALETEWIASASWTARYPYVGGVQLQSLLSIRMNRSPCPRCAKNLHRYCRLRNLSLRIKSTFMHELKDAKGRTGVELLDSKNKPVRQWDTARIFGKAPSGRPASMAAWNDNQLTKKGNPYRHEGRDDVEANNTALFQTERTNYNIPLLTGWSGHNPNLSRATIQNKPASGAALRNPPVTTRVGNPAAAHNGQPGAGFGVQSAARPQPATVGVAQRSGSQNRPHWPPAYKP